MLSVTDPLGHQTTYTYDALDRILSVTLPKPVIGSALNFVTTYSYDNYDGATGLVFTHQTDPNAKLTKQGFDQFGQLVRSIDTSGSTTTFTYTKGLLTSIADANGNVTSYAYNGLKQLTTTTFPDGTTETYTYKQDGLLNSKKDRKNVTISFNYDRLKRISTKNYPSGSTFYTYQGQKLTSVDWVLNGDASQSFTYDSSYRVASNVQGTRGTISYSYDGADRVASYTVTEINVEQAGCHAPLRSKRQTHASCNQQKNGS